MAATSATARAGLGCAGVAISMQPKLTRSRLNLPVLYGSEHGNPLAQ